MEGHIDEFTQLVAQAGRAKFILTKEFESYLTKGLPKKIKKNLLIFIEQDITSPICPRLVIKRYIDEDTSIIGDGSVYINLHVRMDKKKIKKMFNKFIDMTEKW